MPDIKSMANILYNNILSPDAIPERIKGELSVSLSLSYAVFDTEPGYETETQRIGIMTAINVMFLTARYHQCS